MVLQHERPIVDERPPRGPQEPLAVWRKGLWPSLLAVLAVLAMVFVFTYDRGADRVQEYMPEYDVDTLAVPKVAATTGGPLVATDFYVGSSDANFDPDPPTWWMPEYEVDTALDAAGKALTPIPVTDRGVYVGSSDANFDPDV